MLNKKDINKQEVKIIPQAYETADGIERSYGVIVDGRPRGVYFSLEEVLSFLRGLYGTS